METESLEALATKEAKAKKQKEGVPVSAVVQYAQAFLSVMDGWFSARNKRHMRAEVDDFPSDTSLRIVRFVIEDAPGSGNVDIISPEGTLHDVLARIEERLGVKLPMDMCVQGCRVHRRNEVVIIKPAVHTYFWTKTAGRKDANAVVAESWAAAQQPV